MADPAEALGVRLDSAYEDARRPREPRWALPPRVVTALTVVGALIVGFLLAAGLSAGRSAAQVADSRRDALVGLIGARQEHHDALQVQLEELRGRLAAAEAEVTAGLPLNARLREAETAAGLTALAGPGARVTLADATGACPTGRDEDCRVQDTDLQLAVNALFDAGAEAVAINGERIISTTAIRSAGRAILVNYRVLVGPYEIQAIGHPQRIRDRFQESRLAADLGVWSEVYGLQFSVTAAEDLLLPGYSGSVRLRTGRPAGTDAE